MEDVICKQKVTVKKRSAKSDDKTEKLVKRKKEEVQANKEGSGSAKAQFVDQSEILEMEVDGQGTEFMSEEESEEEDGLLPDDESGIIQMSDTNNNTSQFNEGAAHRCDSKADTVCDDDYVREDHYLKSPNTRKEDERREEEAFFGWLSAFMQKQGFMTHSELEGMTGKEKENNKSERKDNKRKQQTKEGMISGNNCEIQDRLNSSNSELTVYQAAVPHVSNDSNKNVANLQEMIEVNLNNLRRFSSSDEEPMNISDETNENCRVIDIVDGGAGQKMKYVDDGEVPHTSQDRNYPAEERSDQIIREAKQAKT